MTVLRTLTASIVKLEDGTEVIRIGDSLFGVYKDFEYVGAGSLGDQINEAISNMDIDLEVMMGFSKISETQMIFLFFGEGRIIRSGFDPIEMPSCPYCGSEVSLENESMDYKYACIPCDVNLFEAETVPTEGISGFQKMSIRMAAQDAGVTVDFEGASIDCEDNSRVMIDNGVGLFVSILDSEKEYQSVYIKYNEVCTDKIEAFLQQHEDMKDEDLKWIVRQMVIGEHHEAFIPNKYKHTGEFGWEEEYNYVKYDLSPYTPKEQTVALIKALDEYITFRGEIERTTVDRNACSVFLVNGKALVGEWKDGTWELKLTQHPDQRRATVPLTSEPIVTNTAKKTKTLQKKMTFEEMLDYLKDRPDYRLLGADELAPYEDDVPGGEFFIKGYSVYSEGDPRQHSIKPSQSYPNTACLVNGNFVIGNTSPLFRLNVYLVKRGPEDD